MPRKSGTKNHDTPNKQKEKQRIVDSEVDELFKLPLADFTSERNSLASRLKKTGKTAEADRVKSLVKPSISAWAVNQLYWNHRTAFEQLIATGQRFRQAQSSRLAGKVADMRQALDARREALTKLESLASEVLRDAGHNPTQDTMRRVTTTLDALSAYSSRPDAPPSGRLSQDVDPPGFEMLGSFAPGSSAKQQQQPLRVVPSPQSSHSKGPKTTTTHDERRLKEERQARIAAAKGSLQDSKRTLTESRAFALKADLALKKANTELKEAEKAKRDAEQRLTKAVSALEALTFRVKKLAAEAKDAEKAVEEAESEVEEATDLLESLQST